MTRLLAFLLIFAATPAFAAQDWPQSRRDAQNARTPSHFDWPFGATVSEACPG